MFLPPLGKNMQADIIEECFTMMEANNGTKGTTRVENVLPEQLCFFSPERYSFQPKEHEICYYRKDIAQLKGNRYKSKRSSYNYFVKNYPHQVLPYQDDMLEICCSLYDEWAEDRRLRNPDRIYQHLLDENRQVHRSMMKDYREIGLIGRVVLVGGEIKAYSFGFPLTKNVFCAFAEIADLKIKGLPVFIFREFCNDEDVKQFDFINVMDSFCLGNIEKTKMSFHPSVLLSSYVVCRKGK